MEPPSDNKIHHNNDNKVSKQSSGGGIENAHVLVSESTYTPEDTGDLSAISTKNERNVIA